MALLVCSVWYAY